MAPLLLNTFQLYKVPGVLPPAAVILPLLEPGQLVLVVDTTGGLSVQHTAVAKKSKVVPELQPVCVQEPESPSDHT